MEFWEGAKIILGDVYENSDGRDYVRISMSEIDKTRHSPTLVKSGGVLIIV